MENNITPFETDENGNVSPVLLNANIVKILGDASDAAYTDFNQQPFSKSLSSGSFTFNYVDRFTGFDDAAWGSGKEEKFGLIYQSKTEPDTYLFSFRGTDSLLDALLDVESAIPAEFVPFYTPQGFPRIVHVGDGFYKIYSTSTHGMPGSMREQLFQYIDQLKPKHIFITGHSLGCPLGSLFALDIAASRPTQISNINFASPRVGTRTWEHAYNTYVTNTFPPTGIKNITIRITNHYDEVPKSPPEEFPTYFKHVGRLFPVSFTTKDYHWDELEVIYSWHSLSNYHTVVNNAAVSTPQGWSGIFPDAVNKHWDMISHNPFTTRNTSLKDRIVSAQQNNSQS